MENPADIIIYGWWGFLTLGIAWAVIQTVRERRGADERRRLQDETRKRQAREGWKAVLEDASRSNAFLTGRGHHRPNGDFLLDLLTWQHLETVVAHLLTDQDF